MKFKRKIFKGRKWVYFQKEMASQYHLEIFLIACKSRRCSHSQMICSIAAVEKFLEIHRNATESFLGILATLAILLTAQEMKFSIKDFFSKCDQIR